jgi:acetoin:2,6-dichlorophenolindophenol oxidoreductase subunit alpha
MADERHERREALRSSRVARWERMLEIRRFEDRTKELFGEGLIHGTTHTCQGQEAVAVGLATALRTSDQVCCTYRGHGHALALGMTPREVLGEIAGRTIGCMGGLGGSMHLYSRAVGLLPTFAIVGAGIPVAAGAAYAAEVQGRDDIAVAIFGDGATNIGAFHEGLNLAAIWKLPVLFVIENNVYGEYSRYDLTTPVADLAVRATSYAMANGVVDGQDLDAMTAAATDAVDRVRSTRAPMLLEVKTYRYAGHSRADTAPYRPAGEFDEWFTRDPIDTFERRLIDEGVIDAGTAAELRSATDERIEGVVAEVLAAPVPEPAAMFANVLAPAGD